MSRSAGKRWFALALALACGSVASCAELTPPEAYAPTTSSTVAQGPEQETASQVEERTGPADTNEEFVPTADPGYVPTLLVSSDRAVFAVDGLESVPLGGSLDGVRSTRTVDDMVGGLVIEELDGSIVYHQAQGEPEVLDDSGSTLLDVGYWDGSPRAFVQAAPGRVDWIRLVSERPGSGHERQIHIDLPDGEEIVSFSASRDLQAVVVQDAACGELRFFGSDGGQLAIQGPPAPECTFPGRPSFGAVALSPDGGAVAYTIVTYRGDGTELATQLAARELFTRSEVFFSRPVGADLDVISSLSFDGERVAFIRSAEGAESVTLMELRADSSELFVDLLASTDIYSVAFARLPLAAVS